MRLPSGPEPALLEAFVGRIARSAIKRHGRPRHRQIYGTSVRYDAVHDPSTDHATHSTDAPPAHPPRAWCIRCISMCGHHMLWSARCVQRNILCSTLDMGTTGAYARGSAASPTAADGSSQWIMGEGVTG